MVDDGSSDRTAEIARKAGAEVIVHEVNKGKGAALKTGFAAAANFGADIIVTMDSDGQHNPAEIQKLVNPIIRGKADMVNGSRYLNGLGKNTPSYRRVGQTMRVPMASEFAVYSGVSKDTCTWLWAARLYISSG